MNTVLLILLIIAIILMISEYNAAKKNAALYLKAQEKIKSSQELTKTFTAQIDALTLAALQNPSNSKELAEAYIKRLNALAFHKEPILSQGAINAMTNIIVDHGLGGKWSDDDMHLRLVKAMHHEFMETEDNFQLS